MPQLLNKPIAQSGAIAYKHRKIIASVLSWDLYREVSPDEIESFRIVNDVLWVNLTGKCPVSIAVETFHSLLTILQAQRELDQYIEEQSEAIAPEPIEIDCANGAYRVWKSTQLIGTYYRDNTGKWLAQPRYGQSRRYKTANQAQKAIVATTSKVNHHSLRCERLRPCSLRSVATASQGVKNQFETGGFLRLDPDNCCYSYRGWMICDWWVDGTEANDPLTNRCYLEKSVEAAMDSINRIEFDRLVTPGLLVLF